jgi:hypothetical protein
VAKALDILRSPFAFLFTSSKKEELVAEHLIREHHHGRSLEEIVKDAYVTNRLSPDQVSRVLARPEVLHAFGDDVASGRLPGVPAPAAATPAEAAPVDAAAPDAAADQT